jgi:hypothetical protein
MIQWDHGGYKMHKEDLLPLPLSLKKTFKLWSCLFILNYISRSDLDVDVNVRGHGIWEYVCCVPVPLRKCVKWEVYSIQQKGTVLNVNHGKTTAVWRRERWKEADSWKQSTQCSMKHFSVFFSGSSSIGDEGPGPRPLLPLLFQQLTRCFH